METILLPLDGSPLSERALPLAAALTQGLGKQLRLLHVKEPRVAFDTVHDLQASFHAAKWHVRQLYGYEPEAITRSGHAAHVIAEEAGREHVWAIVMASHSREALPLTFLGSVAEQVIDAAAVPVFLVPASVGAPGLPRFKRILLPFDGSEQAEVILQSVNRFARSMGAEIVVLRVVQLAAERDRATAEALAGAGELVDGIMPEELAARHPHERRRPKTVQRIEFGDPAKVITAMCGHEEIDLVAFAAYGWTSLDQDRLSRVAEAVLRHSRVPLMVFGRAALRRLMEERHLPIPARAPGAKMTSHTRARRVAVADR